MGRFQSANTGQQVRMAVLLASLCAFFYLFRLNPQGSPDRPAILALSVLVLVLGLWMTEYLPMAVSGLIGCFLLYFFGTYFQFGVLISGSFSGFAVPSVWFAFSGLVIGGAMGLSGLARRISLMVLRYTGNSYSNLLFGTLILSGVLVFFIPSTDARTVVLMSLIAGMSGVRTEEPDAGVMKGLSLLVPFSSSIMGIGVLASVSSITAVGMIEKYGGSQISYVKWLVMFLPAELLTMTALYFLVKMLFPAQIARVNKGWIEEELVLTGPVSAREQRAAVIIGSAVLLFLTGSFTGLRSDVVAMACAALLLLPNVGVIGGKELATRINWLIAPIFLGSAFSIVNCLEATGMLARIGAAALNLAQGPLLDSGYPVQMLTVCGVAGIMHLFTAHSSMLIASFVPVVLQWADALDLGMGIPLIFVWGSQLEIMAFQSSSLTIAYGYGAIQGIDILKIGIPLALVQLIGGTLILSYWWKILGLL